MKLKRYGMSFVTPAVLIMLLLIYLPTMQSFYYSFVNLNLLNPQPLSFQGFTNYITLLTDPKVLTAIANSLIITVLVLFLSLSIGLAFGVFLNRDTKIKGILTAIAIIPWAIPGIVSGIIWRWMFHPSFGLINSILLRIGVIEEPIQWLSSRFSVLVVVAFSVAWRALPLVALTVMSALQSIPQHLYESASMDGSTMFQSFFRITLPLLTPSLVIASTTTFITAINVLDEIVSLVGMASVNNTLMTETYLRTFKYMNFSQGSALSFVVMLGCVVIGIIYIKALNKEEGYS